MPPGLPPPGTVISYVEMVPALQRLVRHGYVFVAVAVRGSGASFGRYEGLFSPAETRDAYDAMDWIVAQPWSDGNVGMWGASYLGITQYMAASTHHPALKAIVPNVALFDFYDVIYPGGVHRDDMIRHVARFWDAASVPLTIVNWGGDDTVTLTELLDYISEITAVAVTYAPDETAPGMLAQDPTRRIAITGPCEVAWRDGVRQSLEAHFPGCIRSGSVNPA